MKNEPQLSASTWLASIIATCFILLVFQKILWLVVPGLLALVLYYCVRPVVQRLVRAGLRHGAAAIVVAGTLFLVTVLAVILLLPIVAARASGWKAATAHYIQAGLDFLAKTEDLLA